MSPNGQAQNVKAENNVYTVILAVAVGTVVAVAAFVAYMCQSHYGTIFKIPQ